MVLPPPAAHNESGAREAAYIEQIKLGLRLNRAGILIHVDQGRPEHLGKLVRALLPEHPDLDVFTDVRAVTRVEPGSVMVLVPKPEDAEWLNLNRPIFAQRKLAVILYCDRQTTLALAERAVDFFDWVSQHHTAPDGPPDFAVEGFRKAVAANAPGIVWTGSVEGLARVFEAAFPGETLRWVDQALALEKVLDVMRSAGDAWVACRVSGKEQLNRFLMTIVAIEKRTRLIVVTAKLRASWWWPVNYRRISLQGAQSKLVRAGMSHPGRLAGLMGLEWDTVDLAGKLLDHGVSEVALLTLLVSDVDPGVALAKKAFAMGFVEVRAVGLRIAPAPFLRALDNAPDVRAWRDAWIRKLKDALAKGKKVDVGSEALLAAMGGKPQSKSYLQLDQQDNDPTVFDNLVPVVVRAYLRAQSTREITQLTPLTILRLPAEMADGLGKGAYKKVLDWLAQYSEERFDDFEEHAVTRCTKQLRARIWLDMRKYNAAASLLYSAIRSEVSLASPSSPLFAELMLDLALLLHRKGDPRTPLALLRKLLNAEWVDLHVDNSGLGADSPETTKSTAINDFIHLFLAQSNTPPPLPPESRARALRILAEVLLSQGRYEEAEDVAQKAHETALSAPEIARPETWRALALHGRASALQGRAAEGKNDLQHAIEIATNAFGKTHAEVARLWLDLARIQARIQDNDTADVIGKSVDTWKHAECDVKERDDALEELRHLLQ